MISLIFALLSGYWFLNTESTFLSVLYFLLFVLNAVAAAQWINNL